MALAKDSNKLFPEKSQDLFLIFIHYDFSAVLITSYLTLYSHWASVTCHLLIQHVLLIVPSILFSSICFSPILLPLTYFHLLSGSNVRWNGKVKLMITSLKNFSSDKQCKWIFGFKSKLGTFNSKKGDIFLHRMHKLRAEVMHFLEDLLKWKS